MDRTSNNFMNSLRTDKTPSKSSQKSKHNTPSPYPQRTPVAANNSSNNTKMRALIQVGTQSQKVGKQANRQSLNNAYVNKSVSPQPSQMHTFGQDRGNQSRMSCQNRIGNDYMKIFNMESIINAGQPRNGNQQNKNEIFVNDNEVNVQPEIAAQQYFSTSANVGRRVESSQQQNKSYINGFQANRPSTSNQNNLFAQSQISQVDENNQFFRKDSNVSSDQQKTNQQIVEQPNFFRTNYQQEKLFQGAQKTNSSVMEDENKSQIKIISPFFSSNSSNGQSQLQNNNQISQLNSKIDCQQQNNNLLKNQSNIFALRGNNSTNNVNCNTGIVLQEINQNPQLKSTSDVPNIQRAQRDVQSSQPLSNIPANLKDQRLRHKQLKSESDDKSLNMQKSVLDKIKDMNEKMKYNAKRNNENINKSESLYEKSFKIDIKSENNSIAAPTIADENKIFEDSFIQKLRQVVNQEEDNEDDDEQNSQDQFYSGNLLSSQENSNRNVVVPMNNNERNKLIATKLDMIQESNASKSSFMSGVFYQSREASKREQLKSQANNNQNGLQKSQSNLDIFGSQISDIFATRKNLFGKYSHKEEDDQLSENQNQGDDRVIGSDFEPNLFESSDESIIDKKSSKRYKGQNAKSQQEGKSMECISGDMSVEGKQNMTNSILDRAFISDPAAAGIYSADRNDTSIRLQEYKNCETTFTSQNARQFHSDVFATNQNSNGFNKDMKKLDQMGFQDISPIQSQIQAKSSNSGSKKENNILIQQLQLNHHIPSNNAFQENESDFSVIHILNSQSNENAKNSTKSIKKQEIGLSSQHYNLNIPYSQSLSHKPDTSSVIYINPESLLKEEIQTPVIQQKLKQFLEDVGYYSNEQKKEQINDIMAKITLGLVIDKANIVKSQQFDVDNKTIIEEGVNRQSIGQFSDYKSCQSRLSINAHNVNDTGLLDQIQETGTVNQLTSEKKDEQTQNKIDGDVIYQESIENKHFEVLKREVEFLYQMCKGEDQAEKEISQKIVNDVLCPKFGQKTLSEAIKQAIKKSRSIRTSQLTKNKKEEASCDQSLISNQTIQEKDEEENDKKADEIILQILPASEPSSQNAKSNRLAVAVNKRKAPSRANTRKRSQQQKASTSLVSSSSAYTTQSESEDESNTSNLGISNAEENNNQSKNVKKNKNKNKKLKK